MATPTYTPIASITLGSSASSVTFSSIPQDYGDLILVMNVKYSGVAGRVNYVLNGDSATANYSRVYMAGSGSSATSGSDSNNYFTEIASSSGDPGVSIHHFQDYSATDKHKTTLGRTGFTNGVATFTIADAKRWANTDAINSIAIVAPSIPFAAGGTFSLYGVAK